MSISATGSTVLAGNGSALLSQRKGDALYHALKRRVLLAEFGPGASIAEQHVAALFGCSQGTVREALMRLEQDGLVARRSYQGTVVATTSVEEAAAMVDIRMKVEAAGAMYTAGNLATEYIDQLQHTLERMGAASDAGDAYACSELDREFHAQLLRVSGMHALEPILRRCTLHMHRFTFGPAEALGSADFRPAHQRLLRAVVNGPYEAARDAMREHVLAVLRQWSPELLAALGTLQRT